MANGRWWRSAAVATAAALAITGYAIFMVAPTELTMREIQRIFYFHAAAGIAAYAAFFVSFLASIGYLAARQPEWDWLAVATAECGLMFCTVNLVSGPIWAKPVWGVWWTWDARLTLTFILELLYIAYLLLRSMVREPDRRATVSAAFGIFAFIDVPLSYFSIRWWRTEHPQPVLGGGPGSGLDPRMMQVFVLTILSLLALLILLARQRYRLEALRHRLSRLAMEAEAPPEAAWAKGATR